MRTTDEIAERAAYLDRGRKWRIKVNPRLSWGNAGQNPLVRVITISPAYLDTVVAYPEALDATILHEMGHYYDWMLRVLGPLMISLALGAILFSPLFYAPFSALIAARWWFEDFFERRADAWAASRMPDYMRHKDAL